MKQKDILIIIILLFIFVLAWTGESIYSSGTSSTISETTAKDIAPIAPTFDTKTIETLRQRQKIIPVYELGNIAPTPVVLPTLPASLNASQGGKLQL